MSFIKKYATPLFIGAVAILALGAAGTIMGVSYSNYSAYEKSYDAQNAEQKGKYAALPEEVFIDDEYVIYNDNMDDIASTKSAYKNSVIMGARDAVVAPLSNTVAQTYVEIDDTNLGEAISGLDRKGGAISFTVTAEKHGMADIEIAMMTNWVDKAGNYYALPNITDYIKIQINKLNVKTEDCELSEDREGFTSLILKNTNLVEGANTLTLTTSAYNDKDNKNDFLYVMPDVRNVTFICESPIAK